MCFSVCVSVGEKWVSMRLSKKKKGEGGGGGGGVNWLFLGSLKNRQIATYINR